MFRWLAKKIDRASVSMRLGATLERRTDKWAKQVYGYAGQEAEQRAKRELYTAMQATGFSPVDCSPQACDAFCQAFLETPLNDPSHGASSGKRATQARTNPSASIPCRTRPGAKDTSTGDAGDIANSLYNEFVVEPSGEGFTAETNSVRPELRYVFAGKVDLYREAMLLAAVGNEAESWREL